MISKFNVISLLCGGLIGLLFVLGYRSEVPKWQFAQVLLDKHLQPEIDITDRLRAIVEATPENDWMKLGLAAELAQQEGREVIRLCDEVLADRPDDPIALNAKIDCLNKLGDFAESLAVYKHSLSGHAGRNQHELNGLAYGRALAKQELPLAIEAINKCIAIHERENGWLQKLYLSIRIRAVLSISLMNRYLGRQEEMIELLNWWVKKREADLHHVQLKLAPLVVLPTNQQIELANNQKEMDQVKRDVLQGELAALLVVRALLYQDLGQDQACDADRVRIKELGFDSNEMVDKLPGHQFLMADLSISSAYLDTRGFLLFQQNPVVSAFGQSEALEDLNLAVNAIQTYRTIQKIKRSNNYQVYINEFYPLPVNTRRIPISLRKFMQPIWSEQNQETERTEAVIRYHRLLVHQQQGNMAAVKRDREHIKLLGYKSDWRLY